MAKPESATNVKMLLVSNTVLVLLSIALLLWVITDDYALSWPAALTAIIIGTANLVYLTRNIRKLKHL